MTLTVAKLAARAGLSPDAIRYYERAGLLPSPPRSGVGYRLYDEGLVERLRFIRGAQRTGLKLRQIRELLEVIDRGMCPCGHTEALLADRIAEIESEMKELREIRRQLLSVKQSLPPEARRSRGADSWPCERTFIEVGAKMKGVSNGKAKG
jgi:DNA-binding transcriptional MerR regulator